MYPITSAVKALFDAEETQVLRVSFDTVQEFGNMSVYDSNNNLILQTGNGQDVELYAGQSKVYDSDGSSVVMVYSDDRLIYANSSGGVPVHIEITDTNVMQSGFSIDRYACNSSKIEVGTAIASELKLKLNNVDGKYNNVKFEGVDLFVEVGIADWSQDDPEITWIPCGHFIPDKQPRTSDIITISALDRMQLFDKVQPSPVAWTTNTDATMTDNNGTEIDFNVFIRFPNTVQGIINAVCEVCGVTLAESIASLPNATLNLPYMPQVQQQVTYRNLIQWCAGIMGTNAWFDWRGQLRFSWFNNVTGYISTPSNRYSSDYHEENVTLTGVQYTNAQNVVIVSGSSDYAIDLKDNFLVGPFISEVLPVLRNALVGFTYRPFTASVINAPYLWPMDAVTFEDKYGNTYSSALTNVNFGINCTTALKSVGETEQTNRAVSPTQLTPEQAKLVNEAINSTQALSESLDQEGIFNRLTNNGEAQGIYMQDGKLYINLTYARAGTLVLGGLDNQNGVLNVLDATGNLVGYINNNGAFFKGTFTTQSANGVLSTETADGEIRLLYNGTVIGSLKWFNAGLYGSQSASLNGSSVSMYATDNSGLPSSGIAAEGREVTMVCQDLTVQKVDSSGTIINQGIGATANLTVVDEGGYSHTLNIVNGIIVGVV